MEKELINEKDIENIDIYNLNELINDKIKLNNVHIKEIKKDENILKIIMAICALSTLFNFGLMYFNTALFIPTIFKIGVILTSIIIYEVSLFEKNELIKEKKAIEKENKSCTKTLLSLISNKKNSIEKNNENKKEKDNFQNKLSIEDYKYILKVSKLNYKIEYYQQLLRKKNNYVLLSNKLTQCKNLYELESVEKDLNNIIYTKRLK